MDHARAVGVVDGSRQGRDDPDRCGGRLGHPGKPIGKILPLDQIAGRSRLLQLTSPDGAGSYSGSRRHGLTPQPTLGDRAGVASGRVAPIE